jgi:hypothetical protein
MFSQAPKQYQPQYHIPGVWVGMNVTLASITYMVFAERGGQRSHLRLSLCHARGVILDGSQPDGQYIRIATTATNIETSQFG